MEVEKAVQGKVTGVIIPPPHIRAVVDKTAQFVARNGKSFEQRILNSAEGKTPKFNFMKEFDPYHAYYEHKIREAEEGITDSAIAPPKSEQDKVAESKQVAPDKQQQLTSTTPKMSTSVKASLLNPLVQILKNIPETPPTPFEFCLATPTGLTAMDVDIIKLTAQYTAANGREFLGSIAQREQRNPQFDFLKPTHMLFSYFTTLVDAYAKVLNPTGEMLMQIQLKRDPKKALELAAHRWDWNHKEAERKKRDTYQADEEKKAFHQVDWFDFTVVEVIDFPENELFEIPGMEALGIKSNGHGAAAENKLVYNPSAGAAGPPPPPPPARGAAPPPPPPLPAAAPLPAAPSEMVVDDEIKVVSNYQPRVAGSAMAGKKPMTMIDPISGRAVALDQVEEHMRIQLLDPKWKEEQKRFVEKQKETGYAEGSSIADNLKVFAKKRGDIFGQAAEGSGSNSAAAIAEELEAERKANDDAAKVQWDGYYSSMAQVQKQKEASTAPPPPPLPMPTITPAVTIQPVMAAYGAAPPPMLMPYYPPMGPGAAFPMPPPPMPYGVPTMYGQPDASAAKKMKVDPSTNLMPAEAFAAKHPNPVTVYVQVPSDPSVPSWNLNGQTLSLSVAVLTSVKDLKDTLSAQHLGNMPVGKFQLKSSVHGFLKDASSLAALNITDSAVFELSVKSRGGKK